MGSSRKSLPQISYVEVTGQVPRAELGSEGLWMFVWE